METSQCASCRKVMAHPMRCSSCKQVEYCSQQCFKTDWKYHKTLCKKLIEEAKQKVQTPINKLSIDDFRDMRIVGQGNFSTIYTGIKKDNGKSYAIKQIDKGTLRRKNKEEDVPMEKHCMLKLLDCRYINRYLGSFENQFTVYIVTEFVEGGELWEQSNLTGVGVAQWEFIWLCQVVKGIQEMHNRRVVHRDIKPQNILLDEHRNIKFVDFGTAKDMDRPDLKGSGNGRKGRKIYYNFVGTPQYMAPECVHDRESSQKSDIFSLAGVLFFLRTGYPAYTGGSDYLVFKKSTQEEVFVPPLFFTKEQSDLLHKMCQIQPSKRIDIKGVMEHQLFRKVDFDNLSAIEKSQPCDLQLAYKEFGSRVRKLSEAFSKDKVREADRQQRLKYIYADSKAALQKLGADGYLLDRIRILTRINFISNPNFCLKEAILQNIDNPFGPIPAQYNNQQPQQPPQPQPQQQQAKSQLKKEQQ